MNDDVSKEIRQLSALVAQVINQNNRLLEAVDSLRQGVSQIPSIQSDLSTVKQDTQLVKSAVTATNADLHQLEQQVAQLEAAG